MNTGEYPPWFAPKRQTPASDVLIIGAGLAGSWMAYELAQHNVQLTLLDSGRELACGASGNNAGVVKPFVTRAPSPQGEFYREAFAFLMQRLMQADGNGQSLAQACQFNQCGVLQLSKTPYPQNRDWQVLNPEQASASAGTRLDSHAIRFIEGGWLNPKALCQTLLQLAGPELHLNTTVEQMDWNEKTGHWTLRCNKGLVHESSHIVLANGIGLNGFAMTRQIPIVPARGQLTRLRNTNPAMSLRHVVSGSHYVMADGDTLISGASFERDQTDTQLRHEDDLKNLQAASAMLPSMELELIANSGQAGVRATTPDRFPVAGPAPDLAACLEHYKDIRHGGSWKALPELPVIDGLSLIGGFGSRGIVSAPWTAHLLARQILGLPLHPESEQHFRRMLANRFMIRDLMRGKFTESHRNAESDPRTR